MHPESDVASRSAGQPGGRLAAWVSFALLTGTALFVLRSGIVLLGFGRVTPLSRDFALWHVVLSMGRILPFALAVGTIGAGVALSLRGLPAALISGALFLTVLSGWPIDDPSHVLDPGTRGGGISFAILALVAFASGLGLAIAVRRGRIASSAHSSRGSSRLLATAVLLAVAVPSTVRIVLGREPPVRPIRETSRELLEGPPAWTVVPNPLGKVAEVGVLTPSLDWNVDGGDLPALLMPPPCEVRFQVGPEEGAVYLRASAGVSRQVRWQLARAPVDCAVVFEIDVNGERRFVARILARGLGASNAWHHAGGREGLPLVSGDVVTLRTSLSDPDVAIVGKPDLRVGFGRLELERAVERPFETPSEEKPNVVLIVMDTLRADELSCYGQAEQPTSALDALAARGILYERAYATSSWTWPSTASILTGLPPEAHGVVSDAACYLDGKLDTVAELLARKNLTTKAFACNPLLDPAKNFDQGFEAYDYSRNFRMSDVVLDDVRTWIDRHADARFFLYLHLVDPHHPVLARPEDFARVGASPSPPPGAPKQPLIEYARKLFDGDGVVEGGRIDPDLIVPTEHQRWIRQAYRASVLSCDHYVGEVLNKLEEHGLAGKTVVAFTSDHGEELFDHGMLGHGNSVYQELVRVPLILAGPGIPHGTRVETTVSNMNLFETLARLGGADPGPIFEGVEGAARIDLASGERLPLRPIYFVTEKGWWWNAPRTTIQGVLEWPWVLHVAPHGLAWGAAVDADPGRGAVRLFDLAQDPAELVDRAAERPDLVLELRKRLEEHERRAKERGSARAFGAGDATLDMLRRIGYTGDAR